MKKDKNVKSNKKASQKSISSKVFSSDNQNVVWCFDNVDNDGCFAFNTSRTNFNATEIMNKLINYGNMTWDQIKKQTHDNNKSKHHFLTYSTLSQDAQNRIMAKGLGDSTESIFSFALQNKLRLIGLRDREKFHIIWYDPEHKFCPSNRH